MLCKQLVASEMGREMLQQQCTEALEKAAMLSLSHQQVLQHLQQVSHITIDIQDSAASASLTLVEQEQ
jgi:hypothetical protein